MADSTENGTRAGVFQLQAEFCKSLSAAKRLQIIHELRAGEKSVGELSERLGIKQSNTSQHLGLMRKVGIVIPRREQTTVYYRLVNPKIAEACDLVRQVIVEQAYRQKELAGPG